MAASFHHCTPWSSIASTVPSKLVCQHFFAAEIQQVLRDPSSPSTLRPISDRRTTNSPALRRSQCPAGKAPNLQNLAKIRRGDKYLNAMLANIILTQLTALRLANKRQTGQGQGDWPNRSSSCDRFMTDHIIIICESA